MTFIRPLSASLLASLLLLTGCFKPSADALIASAKVRIAAKQDQEAMIDLKTALQQAPDSGEARMLLGSTLLMGGNPVTAEVELRKALALGHAEDKVIPLLARAMLAKVELAKLLDEFGSTRLSTPEARADLAVTVAAAHAALGQEEQAAASLEESLAARPDSPEALVLKARLLMGRREASAAEALLDSLLKAHPEDAKVWKLNGDMLRAVKADDDAALAAYRTAAALDRANLPAHVAAIEILLDRNDLSGAKLQLEQLAAVAASHPQTAYLRARLAYRADDMIAARAAVQQALRLAPDYVDALELGGATELKLGAPSQARAYLTKLLSLAPTRTAPRRLLAQVYLQLGAPAEALAALQPLMTRNNDSLALTLAGEAYLANGEPTMARAMFARVVQIDPNHDRAKSALALMKIESGKVSEGLSELKAIASSDPDTRADMALIVTHLASSRVDDALVALEKMEAKTQDKAFAAHVRGRIQLMTKDRASARASFERALSIRPSYFPAAASLAALDFAEKRPEDARLRLEGVLKADPKSVQARIAIAQLKESTGGTPDVVVPLIEAAIQADTLDPAPRLLLVGYHLRSGHASNAVAAAQAATAAIPDNLKLMQALGQAQVAAGDTEQGLKTLTRVMNARPDWPQAHLDMAHAQLASGNRAESRSSLKQALRLRPDLLEAQQRLVALEMAAERPSEALAVARQVQQQRPKAAAGWVLEGDIETARKNQHAALRAYRAALAAEPSGHVAARVHSALLAADKVGEAGRFADEWLSKHPDDVQLRFSLAAVAMARQDFAAAEARYRDVVKVAPANVLALNNLAWSLLRQNKPGGLEVAEKAYRISPNYPPVMDTYAYMLSDEGKSAAAIDLQLRAVAADPKNYVYRLNLARIYFKAGKKDQARSVLDELARVPDQPALQAEVMRLKRAITG